MPLEDRPTEDQFYCPDCAAWVSTPMHERPRKPWVRGSLGECPTLASDVHPCGIPVFGIPSHTPPEIRDKMIAMHSGEVRAADRVDIERAGHVTGDSYPPDWRKHTLYDFSDCEHTAYTIVRIGGWDVEVCQRCGTQTGKHCRHDTNTWNEDGTVLTCDNCGVDGT